MKHYAILFLMLVAILCSLNAVLFTSTTEGGWWMNPNTWDMPGIPGAEDDVIIRGVVFVTGANSCHHLNVQGVSAMLKAGDAASGSLTVHGDLENTGSITNSAYTLTLNLYGNLSNSHNFMPGYFNWLGSGVKTLYCAGSDYGIRTRVTTTISSDIEAIQALSDIYFSPGGTSTQTIKGDGAQVELLLYDPETRTSYNLNSRSCHLEYLKISGGSGSEFNFNNDSSLNSVWMYHCALENLVTTGTHMFDESCSVTNIVNNGSIYNSSSSSRSLYIYGAFTNNGQVGQAPYGYNFSVYTYGDIINNGLFKPTYFYLRGSEDRSLTSSAAHPFQAAASMSGEAGLGTLYAGSGLCLANIPNLSGPLTFHAYTSENLARTIRMDNVTMNSVNIEGLSSSGFIGNDVTLNNCSLSNLAVSGSLSFNSGCSLTNIVNSGVIQCGSNGSPNLSIWGDFVNYGSINDANGYHLTLNAYDDVRNYGTWTAYMLKLYGDDAQDICFGADHPFAGSYFYDMNDDGAIYVVEEDLHLECIFADLNYSSLYLNHGGFDLYLSGTELAEAYLISDTANILNMSSNARVNNVIFQSITNNGTLNLATTIGFSGSLVNNGIVQNYNASVSLNVAGNLINNGTIRNNVSYWLTLTGGGNLINNGIWSNYSTRLDSPDTQLIHFPQEHPYQGSFFYDLNAASDVQTDADLWFTNVQIDGNYSNWRLDLGGWNLHLDNCNLLETNIKSTETCSLYAINGGSLSSCSLQSITLEGTVNFATTTSVAGNLINNGIVQNLGGSINLNVSGNLLNNGTLRNNSSGYNLYLYVGGNAINSGTWSSYSLNLNGTSTQMIRFPSGHGFLGTSVNDSNASSPLTSDADLYFSNCTIDLNNSPLQLSGENALYLDNCNLIDTPVQSGETALFSMTNGGSVSSCSFQAISMSGTINFITSTTFSGNLVNLGTIQNYNATINLYVGGELDNRGVIRNHPSGYNLHLYCGGNIINSGTISSASLIFNGSSNQSLSNTGTISSTQISDSHAASSLSLLTDLSLSGANIDLNEASLILNDGSRLGKTLSLSGGYLTEANVVGGNSSRLHTEGGNWLSSLNFDDIIWEGVVTLGTNVSVNNLVNYATVQCFGSSSSSLAINGRLDNMAEGVIQNNIYNLTLNCYGDVYNHGQLKNYELNFRSTENQSIWQSATADTIRCYFLRKTNAAGTMTMLSNLFLKNCRLVLNTQDLIMESGGAAYALSLTGGYIESVDLLSTGYATLNLSSGAYLGSNVTCGNMNWTGVVQIISSVTINNLINLGRVQNISGNSGYLYVNGSMNNQGIISNAESFPLYLYVAGNVSNSGSMVNRKLTLTGTLDQYVTLNGSETLQYLTINSNIGSSAWYRNGELSGLSGSYIELAMDNPLLFGIWQPYVAASNTWGRIINVSLAGTLSAPQNLILNLEGDHLLLRWDQVPGTTSYTIYSSTQPDEGFSVLISGITDANPEDGIVMQELLLNQPRSFYRVTAHN